jgi:hypothetical protein
VRLVPGPLTKPNHESPSIRKTVLKVDNPPQPGRLRAFVGLVEIRWSDPIFPQFIEFTDQTQFKSLILVIKYLYLLARFD